jgi:hypothetical protein
MSEPFESGGNTNAPRIPNQDDIGVPVKTGVCPGCGCDKGCVRVTPFQWSGEQHLNWYCPCCRHVWVHPERRKDDRVPTKPPLSAHGLMCPTCRTPVAMVKAVTAHGVTFHCPACGNEWNNRSSSPVPTSDPLAP